MAVGHRKIKEGFLVMKIYIASSWRNQHTVEMLTDTLEADGHEVFSFVRVACEMEGGRDGLKFKDLDEWIASQDGDRKFHYDTNSAMFCDLVVYVGPSGSDAWAEIGAAYAKGRIILGLWSKGEDIGLMRRMVSAWFRDFRELLTAVERIGSGCQENQSATQPERQGYL
jgi:hypothetical protein